MSPISFTQEAWEDFQFWMQTDPKKAKKIQNLLREILRHPHEGSGKPEALKYSLQGWWSRRIDLQHRLVYRVENDSIQVISCRYHY
jgi:toxin YoeB